MSKVTLVATLNKVKNKLQTQRAEIDTEITNLKNKLDSAQKTKDSLAAELQQLTSDIQAIQNLPLS